MSEQVAIGGYFELELPASGSHWHEGASRYQSARAALTALLKDVKPRAVWMPLYVCAAVPAAVERLGIEAKFYSLDEELFLHGALALEDGEVIVVVNYFGLCDRHASRYLAGFDPGRVVFDHSQAFYSTPPASLGTIYSPRKFFGVPDGGLLVSSFASSLPEEKDDHSLARSRHLLVRLGTSPEAGYRFFGEAEASLADSRPRRMSQLTERLLSSIRHEDVIARRRENFSRLHAQLGPLNRFAVPDGQNVPMCYPFWTASPGVREALAAQRVYTPILWPELRARAKAGTVEQRLVDECIPLPCDQRYGVSQMDRVADLVLAAIGKSGQ